MEMRAGESGIYAIINTKNGKTYIGSTIDFEGRWKGHKYDLRKGVHCNPHLQNAWNKYGEDAFEFGILECLDDIEELIKAEQFWMDAYRGECRELYNIALDALSPFRGRKHTEKTRSIMSKAKIGNQNALGYRHSEKAKHRISETLMGHPVSEEVRRRMSRSHKGVKCGPPSKETREKLSKASAKPYPTFVNGITGEVIPAGVNLLATCRERGLSVECMYNVVKGRQHRHRGWVLL